MHAGLATTTNTESISNRETRIQEQLYLLAETLVQGDGLGPVFTAGVEQQLTVTLAITSALEHERLEVSVLGSSDGETWLERPLADFRKKSYCGRYQLSLDLKEWPGVRHLRVKWRMSRLREHQRDAIFGFSVALA